MNLASLNADFVYAADRYSTIICYIDLHTCFVDDLVDDFTLLTYTGKVVSIKEFGAFLEFAPGKEGMVHISKLDKKRVNHVEDVLTLGDVIKVKCMGKDKMGRISFSKKDAE